MPHNVLLYTHLSNNVIMLMFCWWILDKKPQVLESNEIRLTVTLSVKQDDVITGKPFRITGPLCGESTGHRWIPLTKDK